MSNLIIPLRTINAFRHFSSHGQTVPLAYWIDRKGSTMSTRVMLMLFSMIATTIIGILITAVLSLGMVNAHAIVIATAVGFALSIPASWLVARAITKITATR